MTVALDAPERHRHAIEPLMESVFQLARRLPIKPGGQCVGQDRRLGRAGRGGERLEAVAQLLRQEELIANAVRFHRRHGQKLGRVSLSRPCLMVWARISVPVVPARSIACLSVTDTASSWSGPKRTSRT